MRREGFLLGVIATGGQVLLLRELISSLQGDELFIGTALCGWLLWGALGAYAGGFLRRAVSPATLFVAAATILPAAIITARLSPLLVTDTIGEIVSFSHAGLLSFLITLPSAFVCGWLFPVIVGRDGNDRGAVVRTYFSEGVGAFVAGTGVAALTGREISTLAAAGVTSCVVLAVVVTAPRKPTPARTAAVAIFLVAAAAAVLLGPGVDRALDRFKYEPYELAASFDTPYSHQTVLRRAGAHVLLTDNMVESTEGDLEAAENLLLPPLAYVPEAREVLIVGQVDLILPPLLAQLPHLSVTAVDARARLLAGSAALIPESGRFHHVRDDPSAYLHSAPEGSFDVVVLPLGESGSYRSLRWLTKPTLADLRRVLRPTGVLHLVTPYDSERYISRDDGRLLSTIRATLATVFPRTILWPGGSTLFLAGGANLTELRPDTIAARLRRLGGEPQFLTEGNLRDRLSPWQLERIDSVSLMPSEINGLERPVLAGIHLVRRSRTLEVDRWAAGLVDHPWVWGWALIATAVALIVLAGLGRGGRSTVLALFFAAGLISLALELTSFYVYQSSVGILYSHLSLLIGAFMLGLALGTRAAMAIDSKYLTSGALALLGVLTALFAATCLEIPRALALPYHAAFQLIVAFGTAALFVAATRTYYGAKSGSGGHAYALDLAGSSVSALVTMPLLLPAVGLNRLMFGVAAVAGLLWFCFWWSGRRRTTAEQI